VAFTVVYDACVLHPAPLRDLLVRIAMTGVVRARWSERILDECFRSILEQRPELKPEALARTRSLMSRAIPDCLVEGHEGLIEGLVLPDANDRHVLAAAIRSGAQAVITFNLKDFPASALEPFGIEALHPDDFVLDVLDLAAGAVCVAVTKQLASLRNPPMTMAELLDVLQAQGLVQSVAMLKSLMPS
jgi:hypothetical protein